KAPWMPDRTEANPNELNQDDARYGFRCCHLKNIWTAPLPPETELSRQMTTSTTSIDIMGLQDKLFGGGQKSASGGIQGDVLATDNNTVGMGDAGIKSAIQGSNVPNPDEAVPSFVSGAMAKAGK